MLPRKKRNCNAPNPNVPVLDYDTVRFNTKPASDRYEKLKNKGIIDDRGFDFSTKEHRGLGGYSTKLFEDNIENRQWKKFCGVQEPYYPNLVYEFYANLPEHQDDKCYVRGIHVPFDAKTINKYYKLPVIDKDRYEEEDEFIQIFENNINHDFIFQVLTHGREVEYQSVKALSIKTTNFSREAKVWCNFISTRFIPTRNKTEVKYETSVLLFTILVWKYIDVGYFLRRQLQFLSKEQTSLWFPSLISMLCCDAGVPIFDHDMHKPKPSAICRTVMFKYIQVVEQAESDGITKFYYENLEKDDVRNVVPPAAPPSSAPSSSRSARRFQPLPDDYENLKSQVMYNTHCIKTLHGCILKGFQALNVDISSFSQLQPPPKDKS